MDGLAFERGGAGGPLLLLLHGLGATAGVWARLLPLVEGRWLALDLPGHGGSAPLGRYGIGDYVDAIAPLVAGEDAVTVLGHSMGGVVGLALAARRPVERVFGVGIKVDWSAEELARFAGLAARPPRLFATEDEALGWHAKLAGLAEPAPALVARGARQEDGQWRAALDPRAFAVEAPDMAALVAAAGCPVHLACGEGDAMISAERLRDFDPQAVAFAGAGHNAMVDRPETLWAWVKKRS
jgi:pimeloyl-ACP methyl ester carboxylesterase